MAEELQSKPSFTPRRKWAVGCDVAVRTVIVLAVLVMLNHLAAVFFHRQYLSAATRVELSARTKTVLQTLTNEVRVIIYYDRNDDFYPTVAALLREYQALNPKIRVETVDYLSDAARAIEIKNDFRLPDATKQSAKNFVLFKSAATGLKREVPGEFLVDTQVEINREKGTYQNRAIAFKGETAFTAMLLAVSNPNPPKTYFLLGHGEHDINSGDELTGYLDFKSLLQQNSVIVETLSLRGTNLVPLDCKLLIIAGPRLNLSAVEVEKIGQYLDEGGRLLALFNSQATEVPGNLEKLLARDWNVVVPPEVVTDPENAISTGNAATRNNVTVGAFSEHLAVKGLLGYYLNLFAPRVVIEGKGQENATDAPIVKVLFASEPSAQILNNPRIASRQFPLAVAVEKRPVPGVVTGRGNTRIIVVGDSFFLANDPMKQLANRDFAYYALNWLLDRPQFTEGIGPKPFTEFRVVLTATQMNRLRWLLLGAIPGGILLFGVLVWWRRRK